MRRSHPLGNVAACFLGLGGLWGPYPSFSRERGAARGLASRTSSPESVPIGPLGSDLGEERVGRSRSGASPGREAPTVTAPPSPGRGAQKRGESAAGPTHIGHTLVPPRRAAAARPRVSPV